MEWGCQNPSWEFSLVERVNDNPTVIPISGGAASHSACDGTARKASYQIRETVPPDNEALGLSECFTEGLFSPWM